MVAPPPIELANLGMADSLILMVMALVVFGPRRLPQIGRQIGKLMYEFRKASNDFKFQMEEELRVAEEADRRKKEEAERQRIAALAPPAPAAIQPQPETIEAQADIGAAEPASGSPDPGQTSDPEQNPSETTAANSEPGTTLPRIQPPLTGERVSASAPAAFVTGTANLETADHEMMAGANGAMIPTAVDSAAAQAAADSIPDAKSPTPPEETVSQHG
jgi:sec-independent protein translocase protein TatB